MSQSILVTGGTGYIGAHAVIALIEAGHHVVVIDNLVNSNRASLDRVAEITGVLPEFCHADIRDRPALEHLFAQHDFTAVMHFAGLKAVGESVKMPDHYHDNNVNGTRVLLDVMKNSGVQTLVFSSSATVYGDPASVPVTEAFPFQSTNPYGQTKLDIELILEELFNNEKGWNIARLRYFNPVGAHSSGLIGEDPRGIPNNLMPFIAQVAAGRLETLSVFGDDYSTPDGTGVRDYIHVTDLVDGHLAALDYLGKEGGLLTVNLGTGKGVSVLEMVRAFEQANGLQIPVAIVDRRPGDVAETWADASLARELLGWEAQKDIVDMCKDTWRWQKANPNGLGDA